MMLLVPVVPAQDEKAETKEYTDKEVEARDGDDILVGRTDFRLRCIDAPEAPPVARCRCNKSECIGIRARKRLEDLLKNRTVRVTTFRNKKGDLSKSIDNRPLAVVQVRDARGVIDVQKVLLEEGLAALYFRGNDRYFEKHPEYVHAALKGWTKIRNLPPREKNHFLWRKPKDPYDWRQYRNKLGELHDKTCKKADCEYRK